MSQNVINARATIITKFMSRTGNQFSVLINFAALTSSGAAMMVPKWHISTPKLIYICDNKKIKRPNFMSKSVPLALGGVGRVKFISRNGLNDFWSIQIS